VAEKRKRRKTSAKGVILAICPLCKGLGKVPRELPFAANPRVPATRPGRLGLKTCPRCGGQGRMGGE